MVIKFKTLESKNLCGWFLGFKIFPLNIMQLPDGMRPGCLLRRVDKIGFCLTTGDDYFASKSHPDAQYQYIFSSGKIVRNGVGECPEKIINGRWMVGKDPIYQGPQLYYKEYVDKAAWVAEAYYGRPAGYVINFKDGSKLNCRVENLEFIPTLDALANPESKSGVKGITTIEKKKKDGTVDTKYRVRDRMGVQHLFKSIDEAKQYLLSLNNVFAVKPADSGSVTDEEIIFNNVQEDERTPEQIAKDEAEEAALKSKEVKS